MELNAYWKDSPQKNSPGTESTTPRYSCGKAVLAEDREVDPVEDLPEAGAPDDGARVDDAAVVEDGPPSLTPVTRFSHPLDAAPLEVVALDAQHRAAVVPDLRHLLAARWAYAA